MSEVYNAESIQTLDFMEHIRRYPGMYLGSKDLRGLHHCIKEVVSNSIDEYLNGAGTAIKVTIRPDGGIMVEDDARGIPHGEHSDGISILEACFGIQNTGGKYINASGEGGYNTSGGEHGIGLKAVNAVSKRLMATSYRDGIREIVLFEKGNKIGYKQEKDEENKHGLTVLFYPDDEVFETITVDCEQLKQMIQEFSYLCTGLKFIYTHDNTTEEFYSDNGLSDYLDYLALGKDFICNPIYLSGREENFQVEAIIGYINNYSSIYKLYTNNIPQEKGTHLTGFKTAWTSLLNQWARENKLLKDKDANLTGGDYEEGQILILNFKMIDPVFKGQNKEELSSSEGRTYVQKLITAAAREYFDSHSKDIKTIVNKALTARKAREAAKKAREAARGTKKDKKSLLTNLPTKLVDAWSKDRGACELFITEGDSASGGLVEARDGETQAVFPIRGKIISAMKTTPDKVFANQEVLNLIKALGLELDIKSHHLVYDKDKLRYGKIMLATDADADGLAIKNLLYTLFWWLCPELILNGHVYATLPPLFKITTSKNKYIFLKDNEALKEYKTQHVGEKFSVNRNKGLGEQNSEELDECIMNPMTRNINQITVADVEAADELFEILMGSKVPPRREYILTYSEEANDIE